MIRVTRLNHVPLILNSDLIEHIDMTPDTIVTLTSGQKFMVLESAEEVVDKVIYFRRQLNQSRSPPVDRAGVPSCQKPSSPSMADKSASRRLPNRPSRPPRRISPASRAWLIALGAIIGGLMCEGGKITDVLQISAAVIVLGGTARCGDGHLAAVLANGRGRPG